MDGAPKLGGLQRVENLQEFRYNAKFSRCPDIVLSLMASGYHLCMAVLSVKGWKASLQLLRTETASTNCPTKRCKYAPASPQRPLETLSPTAAEPQPRQRQGPVAASRGNRWRGGALPASAGDRCRPGRAVATRTLSTSFSRSQILVVRRSGDSTNQSDCIALICCSSKSRARRSAANSNACG
jgi:hypothetical protein